MRKKIMTDKKAITKISTEREQEIYQGWENSGCFHANPHSDTDPFTLMIPPPNVTGDLHVGHALTMTLQDIVVRTQRLRGKDTLYQPGVDHAGIATQLIVERQVNAEGTTSKAMGRDAFVERIWQWKEKSGGNITRQLRRLGSSCDWERERFTLDERSSRAVREAFVRLYKEGKIYRGERLVNWDPKFQSAISDLEVDNIESNGNLWHFKYPIEGHEGQFITIATTRPETMLGDVAIAVNPEDERYKNLVGKYAILPLVGRKIPIIQDEYSDMEKGSGAVKITPAHDFNDFEVGERHGLPKITVLDKAAAISLDEIQNDLTDIDGVASKAFVEGLKGVDRFKARKAIVAEMETLGLLNKIEPTTNQVPRAQRGGEVVEPRLTTQWFFDVSDLATRSIQAVKDGDLEFSPKQWENTFFAWLKEIRPWCISRQLWWGHRIPAWYGPDGKIFVADNEDEASAQAKDHYGQDTALTQDDDVLDTWFSSGLWPFSTLGWPEKTPEFKKYFPGNVLVTGFDIIFFWVARMVMMSLGLNGKLPFKTVVMHGLVRDEKGEKMSKTKGNVIDPLELMDAYGTDALRWTICSKAGAGRDIPLGPSQVELGRNFITKLSNAVSFWEMNGLKDHRDEDVSNIQSSLCQWMIAQTNTAINETTKAIDTFRFDEYASTLYHFIQSTFCDWYIELSKQGLKEEKADEILTTARYTLRVILTLLHPIAPFVTAELWEKMDYGSTNDMMTAPWPTATAESASADQASADIEWLKGFVTIVRNIRAEKNIPYSKPLSVLLKDADDTTLARVKKFNGAIQQLVKTSSIGPLSGDIPEMAIQDVLGEATLIFPLADAIDLSAEKERLAKKQEKLAKEIETLQKRLGNASFVERAPEHVVKEAQDNLSEMQDEFARLDQAIAKLS